MKVVIVVLTVLAISGQGMSFNIDEMAGKYTITTPDFAELIAGLMKFLHYPEADVKKAREDKTPAHFFIRVLESKGPGYSIEYENHNALADPKPFILVAGKETSPNRSDGKQYDADFIVHDKDTMEINASMKVGFHCKLTHNFKTDSVHIDYKCKNKNEEKHNFALDYNRY